MSLKRFLLVALISFGAFFQLISAQAQSGAAVTKLDIFFLLDDSGSFEGQVPTVTAIFSELVNDLEVPLAGVDIGFGVGRFEDYGGPGAGFGAATEVGRPFFLNQPIITASTVGSKPARNSLIIEALQREGLGIGGDDPESSVGEGLRQIATGVGFDGNGDGSTTGLAGDQLAGAIATQINSDTSGDVPAFSTLAPGVLSSGSIGGAGFRADALKLVLLATDLCSVAAFSSGSGIPNTIVGTYSTENVSEFACRTTTPGDDRFGFVSNSLSLAGNSVSGAVAPLGAGTIPATINALNAADIRVIGMGPGVLPVPKGTGAGHDPSAMLSAVARLTGGLDSSGIPIVFDIDGGAEALKDKIVDAVVAAAVQNPGCVDQDISQVLGLVNADSLKLKQLATKAVNRLKAVGISKGSRAKKLAQTEVLFGKSIAFSTSFNSVVTVCSTSACTVVDHEQDKKLFTSSIKGMNKILKKSQKTFSKRGGNETASDLKRVSMGAKTQKLAQSHLEMIPTLTNDCN